MREINKIDVDNLFPDEKEYENAKRKYVANYTEYHPGGFLSMGRDIHNPAAGLAKWECYYPNGFTDWRQFEGRVAYSDVKVLGDKINEIIDSLTPPKP